MVCSVGTQNALNRAAVIRLLCRSLVNISTKLHLSAVFFVEAASVLMMKRLMDTAF